MLKYDEWIKKSIYPDNDWGRRKYEEYTVGVGRDTELYCPVAKTKIDFTDFRERYGKGAAYYALQFKGVYPNQFSHLLYKINDELIPKPADFDAVNSLLGGGEKVSKQIKTEIAVAAKDIKPKKMKEIKPYITIPISFIELKRRTGMTPNAFYLICCLRKDRAFFKYGRVNPIICTEIFEKGWSVSHIGSINKYANEIDMPRTTLQETLRKLEESKQVFIKEIDGETFVITGKHYADGTEAMFFELPEDEQVCDL